jgi:Putative MetA-pathway of phenol degradation
VEPSLGKSAPRRGRRSPAGLAQDIRRVFFRLGLLTGGFADSFHDNGNQYTGGLTLYGPFNARFEVRLDIPFIVSNRVGSGDDYHSNFGDLQITPRVLISESKNFTQSFDVTFRIATGSEDNGNDFGSATPLWNFWCPVTRDQRAFDFQVVWAIMKVY